MLCPLNASGERMRRDEYPQSLMEIWALLQNLLGERAGLIVSAGQEVSECTSAQCQRHQGIKRAEPLELCKVSDGGVRIACINHLPADRLPCDGALRVEGERALDEQPACFELVDDIGEHMASPCQHDRVILAEGNGRAGESRRLTDLFGAVGHPAGSLSSDIANGAGAVSGCESRVPLNGLREQWHRSLDTFARILIEIVSSTQIVIVGVEAFGRFALGA